MKKIERTFFLCCSALLLCLVSCISQTENLDLDKKISYDMHVAPGGFAIPLGNMEKIFVDSLIKTGDDGSALVALPDGQYAITMDGSIDKVDTGIEEISINVDDIEIDPFVTSFNDPTPGSVKLEERESVTEIVLSEVNVDKINSSLPVLSTDTSCTTVIPAVPGITVQNLVIPIAINNFGHPMAFTFNYSLPEDVDRLYAVWLGSEKNSHDGQRIALKVNMKGIFDLIANPEISIESLSVDFPDIFTIEKDPSLGIYIPDNCVKVEDGHKFLISMNTETQSISGLSKDNPVLPVTLYVKKADFSSFMNGEINYGESVIYSLNLKVKGDVDLREERSFNVGVSLNEQMKMADISAGVKSKSVDMATQSFNSQFHITGLDDISSVRTVNFDNQTSLLNIAVSDFGISPFSLSAESFINLVFPDYFTFGDECLTEDFVSAGIWNGKTLKIDPSKAMGKTLTVRPLSIDVSAYPVKADATMDIPVEISYDGSFVTDPRADIRLSDLTVFGTKKVAVKVSGELNIDNAEVVTKSIVSEFDEESSLSINEEVDEALKVLRKVEFKNPSAIDVKLQFKGVPSTIEALRVSDFVITFPDFLKMQYSGNDNRISLSENKLTVNGLLNAIELADNGTGFTISGLSVNGMDFNPELKTTDGRIMIDSKVTMKGQVKVENQTIHSKDLDDITVTPTVDIATIKVKDVTGQVDPVIDPIHESIALSLSDDIDFLKDGKNRLKLSNPQITLNLNTSVTVPVKLDLNISSKDKDGNFIKDNISPDDGPIIIPACSPDADVRRVQLVLLNHDVVGNLSDDIIYVRISHLSDLMTTVPDSVIFDLTASADQSVEHFVDLERELYVSGDYSVSVPLSFDDMFVEYCDTIKDLSEDLEDISETVTAANLELKSMVTSTIPFGVSLSFKAIDKAERPIDGISIEPVTVSAGSPAGATSDMMVKVSISDGTLKLLDALIITARCESGNEGASIEKGQYIQLTDMKLFIPDGLDIDLTDKLNDDDK